MKKIFLWLSIVLIALAAGGTLWLLSLARQYRQFVDFGKNTQASYAALAKEYPADRTDRTDQAAAISRWDEFLKVRERAAAAIPTSLDQRADQILAMRKPGLGGQVSFLLELAPELRPVVNAHLAGLREARMSPVEYRWRLGSAMLVAAENPGQYPAGKAYRDLAGRIGQFAHRLAENTKGRIRTDQIPDLPYALQTLRKEFGSYPVAPPEAARRLESARETAYLLDILVVAVESEQLADEGVAKYMKK